MSDHVPLWLGKPAPRYTSYPPATQFAAVTPARTPSHLAELAGSATPISLYLHIPFCRSLCLFCGCHQVITQRADRMAAYQVALHQEIKLVREKLGKRVVVSHLHFGGGSPSSLTPTQFTALMEALGEAFAFTANCEKAIELDPRTTAPELVEVLARTGINRASLGVQDFNPKVQETIHRVQPIELVRGVMENLRGAGITALSLDLMYGLPHQTEASLAETAQQALTLDPERISLFSYAHVPGFKTYQKALEDAGLPNDADKLKQERVMRQALVAAGYAEIGIDHFAKPTDSLAIAMQNGTLGRNFQGYTDDVASMLLGLGASSISDVPGCFVQNEPDLEIYQQRVAQGELPLKRVCFRSADDHRRGRIISDLMCKFTAELGDVSDLGDALARLVPYERAGLVRRSGSQLTVDRAYPMAVRAVAACFDRYYDAAKIASKVA